jgi:hypothetical protein
MKRLLSVSLFVLLLASVSVSAYDPGVYENIHITLLTNVHGGGFTTCTFGYINDVDTMIYISNDDPYFLIKLPIGSSWSSSLTNLQYFYPGTHNTLYGPEFPVDSGKTMWIKFLTFKSPGVLNEVIVKIGNDSVIINRDTEPRVLPVELTSFTAILTGNTAQLNWITATELNNSGFRVERSIENTDNWVYVTFIEGKGTSNVENSYSYKDENLSPNAYIYRLIQIDNDGVETVYIANQPKIDIGVSGELQLGNNYPNPFNPSTEIRFSVPQDGYASLKVYNVIGQEVAILFLGQARAGHYIIATFNAHCLASGIYFARLQYKGESLVQRMLLTK